LSGTLRRGAALIVIAVLVGVALAVLRLALVSGIDDIRVGPWRTSSLIGSTQASPWLRALVAINGILALHREEAIYLTAAVDNDGQPLRGACRYRVEGHDLPARWWSLTAYGADRFLIANPQHRYSASQNSVTRDAQGAYTIQLAREPLPGDWIATGPGRFVLTLRAYNPLPAFAANPATAALPSIVREACP